MGRIERFEDLRCWQVARELAKGIYELTAGVDFRRDSRLRDQIQGAAGSVMHNIAEGFDAGSDSEFVRFLRISRRSASEVQSQLYLAVDFGYIGDDELRKMYALPDDVKRCINGLIRYLHQNKL
jgi:four helix bundle protein